MRPYLLLLFGSALSAAALIMATPFTQAQSGCDYTIGTGEEHTTFESLNLNQTGSNLAGKVVCVRNNKTYGKVDILKSGSSDTQWLTIRSHPQNTGKPQFTSTNSGAVIDVKGSYVIVDGLEVTSALNGDGMEVVGTDHVKLLNVKVSETKGHGIQVIDSSYVWVDSCNVRKAVMSTGNPVGENVRSSNSDHVWITNCLITEDGSGRGGVLNSGQSSYTYFRNNELHLNDSNNLHLGNGEHVVFENNLVSGGCSPGGTGAGFYKQAERYPKDAASYVYKQNDVTVKNNLIINMTKGINILGCQVQCIDHDNNRETECVKQPWKANEQCPFDNVTIENNTVVGIGIPNSDGNDENTEYALALEAHQNHPVENVRIRNNLFHTNNGTEKDLKNQMTGDLVFSGNIWSDVTNAPQGDTILANWSSVFTGNPNLSTCSNERKNPNLYQASTSYAGKGADVSKVGIGRGSDGPYLSPTPTPDWDLNDDGETDVFDFNQFVRKVIRSEENWSRLASFIAALRSL